MAVELAYWASLGRLLAALGRLLIPLGRFSGGSPALLGITWGIFLAPQAAPGFDFGGFQAVPG